MTGLSPATGIPTLRDRLASIVRTVVPGIVGTALAWLASRGLDLTAYTNAVNLFLVPACITVYYSAVRWLEARYPAAGLLLGWRAEPKYVTPDGEPIAPPPVEPVRYERTPDRPLPGGTHRGNPDGSWSPADPL